MEEAAGSNPAGSTKTCLHCGENKPIEEFQPRRESPYRRPECYPCRAKYQNEWHNRNKEVRLKRQAEANRLTRLRNQAKVWEYLSTHPCVDCGESDREVLQFDHVRGVKRKPVTSMLTLSWETIQAEIAKCEVRCAHCHIRVTNRRRLITTGPWLSG